MKKKASKTKKQSKRILKNIKFVSPDSIKPYKNNPRINDMAVPEVEQSLDSFDFLQPVVVDKKGEIIVGHTRWLAAKELELSEIPVIYADHLTPKQAKAYRLADNKTGEISIWDMDLLPDELNGLDDVYTGFDGDELKNILGDIGEVDFPDLPSGDRGSITVMSFTVHTSQKDLIELSLKKAKTEFDIPSIDNESKNGNALAFICSEFL